MSALFDDLPEQGAPIARGQGEARVRRAERDQMVLTPGSLDDLLPRDHMVRCVEAFVARLDLAPLYDAIHAREGRPGHPPADPRLMVALWLYATIDGVGSARELARLCTTTLAYQWLCGGVSMNYHTLADARLGCAAWLDQALTSSIAALLSAGAISLQSVAQDGMRVRASAGAGSFHRRATLEDCMAAAAQQVQALKDELDADAAASSKRQRAAARRAAEERASRLAAAIAALPEAQERAVRNKKKAEDARVSSTDSDATVMKMPCGGFRPAYNTQLAAETEHGLIVGVQVTRTGADQPSLEPMIAQIATRTGQTPEVVLVDGGYFSRDTITRLTEAGIEVLVPPPAVKNADRAPDAPAHGDSEAVKALRLRMAEDQAKTRYRQRARWIEWVNAGCRNRGWQQVLVRGLDKVRAAATWQAMAHNTIRILRTEDLAAVFGLKPHRLA